MKVKGFLLAGAAGIAAVPAAHAADLSVKAPLMSPPPVSWTGWYIGVNAGAVRQSATDAYRYAETGVTNISGAGTGFIGGGQVGYNYQAGSFVYGIEGDISGLSGQVNNLGGLSTATYTSQISWLATVRGRVGVAIGDTMPYLTAGVAISGVNNKFLTGDPDGSYSDTSTRLGLVLGGGIEHMITRNVSVKFEGLWVDGGSKIVGNNLGNTRKTTKFSNSAVIARAGLNLHF